MKVPELGFVLREGEGGGVSRYGDDCLDSTDFSFQTNNNINVAAPYSSLGHITT
jgi:hypothetical protein